MGFSDFVLEICTSAEHHHLSSRRASLRALVVHGSKPRIYYLFVVAPIAAQVEVHTPTWAPLRRLVTEQASTQR